MSAEARAGSIGPAVGSRSNGVRRLLGSRISGWRHSLSARFIVLSVATNAARLLVAVAILRLAGDIHAAVAGDMSAGAGRAIHEAVDRILLILLLVVLAHVLADFLAFRLGRDLISRPVARLLAATGASAPDAAADPGGSRVDALTETLNRFRTTREAADEIARLNEELQDQIRDLDSFTYSVSHDLRAPLRAIDGFAQLLEERPATTTDPESRAYLTTIRQSARHMNGLIEGLLQLSRIGREAVQPEVVEPADMVRAVLEEHGIATDPGVEILVDPLPPCVADPLLLRQVYANLLENARKFSRDRRPARIHIGAEAGLDENGDPRMHYFVRDNGVGFDNRHAPRLFGMFQRLHRADEFEGTGVGLAIVHRIIDRLGGRIWAHGEVGVGATFWFTLPSGAP